MTSLNTPDTGAVQLDLFAPTPMPALSIQPNAAGVYPDDEAEAIILPYDRKGWRGLPLAEVRLLHLPQGWLQAACVCTPGGSGFGHGLCERFGGGFHSTRHDALDAARSRILRFAERDDPVLRKIRAWALSALIDVTERRAAA